MNDSDEPKDAISSLLNRASMGDSSAARSFYSGFSEYQWVVAQRPPPGQLQDEPTYPSEVFGILAVSTDDKVIIPIFSVPEFLVAWAGSEVPFRTLSGNQILASIPENWWLGVNPGQNIEKELSPWELGLLRKDLMLNQEATLNELVAELYEYAPITQVETSLPDPIKYQELIANLIQAGTDRLEVEAIYLLERRGLDLEENEITELLVGVAIKLEGLQTDSDLIPANLTEETQDFFSRLVAYKLIGSNSAKVYTGIWGTQSIALSMFSKTKPIFSRNQNS